MADVIRAALDAHPAWWWTPYGISTEVRCTGPDCYWTASAVGVQPRDSHRAHQAEVATTAVLEVVARVFAAHQEDGDGCTGCDWFDGPGGRSPRTRGDHLQSLFAAALAGEG